jgi:hypothetical protein
MYLCAGSGRLWTVSGKDGKTKRSRPQSTCKCQGMSQILYNIAKIKCEDSLEPIRFKVFRSGMYVFSLTNSME